MAAEAAAYGIARGMVGDVSGAIEASLFARRLADEIGDRELAPIGGAAFWLDLAGRADDAWQAIADSIELCDGDFDRGRRIIGFSVLIWSIFYRGWLLVARGPCDEAERDMSEAIRLAREHDDVESLGWAHGGFGTLAWQRGEGGDALAHTREAIAFAEGTGSSISRIIASQSLAFAHLARHEWAEAVAAADEALRMMRESRTGLQFVPLSQAAAAEGRLGLGDVDGARDTAAKGAEAAVRMGVPGHEAMCRLQLGRALAHSRPTEARAELEHAFELAEPRSPTLLPLIRMALAELAGLHGREDARRRQLQLALSELERHGSTGHARRVAEQLAALGAPS